MSTLTIRNVEPAMAERLRRRAASNGRTIQAELHRILSDVVGHEPTAEIDLAEAVRRRFAPFGGVDDLPSHPPTMSGEPTAFDP